MTVRDGDKAELLPLAESFAALGFDLYATGGTALYLNKHGVAASSVRKIDEGSPNILDLIDSGKIAYVVNTPTRGRKPGRDGFKIRRKAVESSIPCFTSLDTVKAMLLCLKMGIREEEMEIVNLTTLAKDTGEMRS
ncbi:MAG TPA: carbamoyl-phosphate synthase large subunit, partial [Clostridiales bacterium]|nr:carbamoyl-phosphate synthase large subunit [Clostridiales bacterium]